MINRDCDDSNTASIADYSIIQLINGIDIKSINCLLLASIESNKLIVSDTKRLLL